MDNEQIVLVRFTGRGSSSSARPSEVWTRTLIGTPEQIAENVRESILRSLQYGSRIAAIEVIPSDIFNVVRLGEKR